MTARQREIVRLALVYAQANLDDVYDAFAPTDSDVEADNERPTLDLNGEIIAAPTEDEVGEILKELQG